MRTSYLDQTQSKFMAQFLKNAAKAVPPAAPTPKPQPAPAKNSWLSSLPREQITVEANGCWVCKKVNPDGYGVVEYGEKKRPYIAARIAWRKLNPTPPAGKWVSAKCGDRRCCNPEHMELVDAPNPTFTWEDTKARWPTIEELEAMCQKTMASTKLREPCWSYTEKLSVGSYALLEAKPVEGQKPLTKLAAKHAWELKENRQLPENRQVARVCHNRFCCNPAHIDDVPDWVAKILWGGPRRRNR